MVRVVIGGDVCPIGGNEEYFVSGAANRLFNDLLEYFEQSELSMVNLECPLISSPDPIFKRGPILSAQKACVNGFVEAKIDVVNLANNHIKDHGSTGLNATLETFRNAGIRTLGAGRNTAAARNMLVKRINGIRIGVLGVAESEFSIATENSSGANSLNLIDFVRNVNSQKANFDFLIVLLHGGNEHYPFPSPRLKETCQFMIEMGADVVVVQHTHCPGSYESYLDRHIVYGQGNLIFDLPNQKESFYEGFLVKLDISDDLTASIDFIPYEQGNTVIGARRLQHEKERSFLKLLEERSEAIIDDAFVQEQWLRHCTRRKYEYLGKLLGHSKFISKLNGNGRLMKYLYTANSLAGVQNVVSCESHREVVETIFNHNLIHINPSDVRQSFRANERDE